MPPTRGPDPRGMLADHAPSGWRRWLLRLGKAGSTVAITGAALSTSLVITYVITRAAGAEALMPLALFIATLVPVVVSPVVSHFGLSLLYELEDARYLMREAAIRDPLTGLFNRRFFVERLRNEFERARQDGTPMSLVMIDIDHFKRINDRRGHAVGDDVLKAIGSTLAETLGPGDVSSRYGGEEFVALLPDLTSAQAARVAERIRSAIGRLRIPAFGDEPLPQVTASIGVTTLEEPDETYGVLLAHADQAMYQAKAGGRNRCVVFTHDEPVETQAPRKHPEPSHPRSQIGAPSSELHALGEDR